MPFHAHPSGRSGYAEPATRPELPSPTGVFRLLALVAAIAGSSVAMTSGAPSALAASTPAANPVGSAPSAGRMPGTVTAGSSAMTVARVR